MLRLLRCGYLHLTLSLFIVTACAPSLDSDNGCASLSDVPPQEMRLWLAQGCYLGWDSESRVLKATQSDSYAQIFINPELQGSLAHGYDRHPVGAGAVRVMYEPDQETVWGYALSLKVAHESDEDWFWFESFEHQEEPKVSGFAASGCIGCHATGVDFVQSEWPLR